MNIAALPEDIIVILFHHHLELSAAARLAAATPEFWRIFGEYQKTRIGQLRFRYEPVLKKLSTDIIASEKKEHLLTFMRYIYLTETREDIVELDSRQLVDWHNALIPFRLFLIDLYQMGFKEKIDWFYQQLLTHSPDFNTSQDERLQSATARYFSHFAMKFSDHFQNLRQIRSPEEATLEMIENYSFSFLASLIADKKTLQKNCLDFYNPHDVIVNMVISQKIRQLESRGFHLFAHHLQAIDKKQSTDHDIRALLLKNEKNGSSTESWLFYWIRLLALTDSRNISREKLEIKEEIAVNIFKNAVSLRGSYFTLLAGSVLLFLAGIVLPVILHQKNTIKTNTLFVVAGSSSGVLFLALMALPYLYFNKRESIAKERTRHFFFQTNRSMVVTDEPKEQHAVMLI